MSRATKVKTRAASPPTREERAALGKSLRAKVPRGSHAEFEPGPTRPDPVAQLRSQDEARVPELLPIRYGRMSVSAFTYFRGAALPMASDLSRTPDTGLSVQSCGDAHLSNFGLFASPERRLVFDINDFDETLPGPWEWDVKRLAASMEIAGRDNDHPAPKRRATVLATVAAYRRAMRELAGLTALEVWYAHGDVSAVLARYDAQLKRRTRKRVHHTAEKAQTKDNLGSLGRFAGMADGGPRIVPDPPVIVPVDDIVDGANVAGEMHKLLRTYRTSLASDRRVLFDRYRFADMARKVVGVGSVGTRSWMVLMLGDDPQDPLFLQAKEAGASVLESFVGPSEFDNAGQRVVVGQRLMQAASDIFLGWIRLTGLDGRRRDFYVRQLRDWKGSAAIETMGPSALRMYGEVCGWTLARAHARTGDRIAIASYLGSGNAFEQAVAEFADAYADQNESDYAALLKEIRHSRIEAETGL
jgi:uncharacterized protein (DUF2252 family)